MGDIVNDNNTMTIFTYSFQIIFLLRVFLVQLLLGPTLFFPCKVNKCVRLKTIQNVTFEIVTLTWTHKTLI